MRSFKASLMLGCVKMSFRRCQGATKTASSFDEAAAVFVVIRLEFHFLRQFVEKSSVLLSFQKFYKALYINNI